MKIRITTKNVYVKQAELLFDKFWTKSQDTSDKTLTFDFSSVHYMDLMQICQIFLWIEMLLLKKKEVHLTFQGGVKGANAQPSRLFFVANSYGFFAELSRYETLSITPNPASYQSHLPHARVDAPLIHLTLFERHAALEEFLTNEDFHKPSQESAQDQAEPIPKSLRTAVRNIVLREVAGNVFSHAGDVPAILAVSRKTKVQLTHSRNPAPVKDFARRSVGSDYIQIIVGDFGIGIPAKLQPSFMEDTVAREYFPNDDPFNVIEYSFWKDSSSRRRDIEEAIYEVEEAIDEVTPNKWVPPTGLYFVKQLVEHLKGMICVRAANTIWCSDYTLGTNPTVQIKSWDVARFATLPGTVIQIILPVAFRQDTLQLYGRANPAISQSIEFSTYIGWDRIRAVQHDDKAAVTDLVKQVRAATILAESGKGILIDLNNRSLSSKRLFQVAACLMYLQERNKPIVLVNVLVGESWSEVRRQIENLGQQRSLGPVHWFSRDEQGILGATQHDAERTQILSQSDVQNFINDAVRANVTKAIQNTFHKDAKVFLPAPSSCYVRGFFQLPEILADERFCSNFVALIAPVLKGKTFVAAVTTSSRLIDLAKMFAEELSFPIGNVFYQASDRPPTGIILDLAKLPRETVLVLSDAVVTGHTVSRVQKFIAQKTVAVALVADMDKQDIIAAVRHSFEIFERKPKEWRYDEIRPISSATHQFVEAPPAPKEEYVSEQVLGQWADADGAVAVGHFTYDQTCYLVFFDTYLLQRLHGDDILESIRGDLTPQKQRIKAERGLVFGFPVNNKAAHNICSQLHAYMGGSIDYVTKSGAIPYDPSSAEKLFVFVDTAASTTRTIRRAMEYASQKGYALLQIYIVVNRARMDEYEFVQGIELFKSVDVRIKSQFRVELPAYETGNSCPACRRKRRLEEEARKSIPASCRLLLEDEANRLKLVPIQEARSGGYDISPDSRGAYGKALEFRQVLERAGADNTMASKSKLLTLLGTLASMKGGIASLVDLLWLESDAIRNGRIWNIELSEVLVGKCLDELYLGKSANAADRKALWVAAGIDFNLFLNTVNVDAWRITEGACAALVTILLLYRENSTAETAIQLLRQVSAKVESQRSGTFSPEAITALREAANCLDLEHYVEPRSVATYNDAIRVLGSVFHEKGSSHPRFRRIFDDARRLTLPSDLGDCLKHAIYNKDSVFNIFKHELHPALKTLIKALPEKLLEEAPYIANLTVANDLNGFRADLEIASSAHSKGSLSPEAWGRYRRSIQETTNRILRQFIILDTSQLHYLLAKCEASIDEILNEFKAAVPRASSNKLVLLIVKDVPPISVPGDVARDLCRTVLENALRYSENGRDVVCEVTKDSNFVVLETRSVPKAKCWPVRKPNHGLARLSDTLIDFGGWLRLPEFGGDMATHCVVTMGLPIKWSLK